MGGSHAYLLDRFTELADAAALARKLLAAANRGAAPVLVDAYADTDSDGVSRYLGLPAPVAVRFTIDAAYAGLGETLFADATRSVHRGGAVTVITELDEETVTAMARLPVTRVELELEERREGEIEDAFLARVGTDLGDLMWECVWPGVAHGRNGVQLTVNGSGLYREDPRHGEHEVWLLLNGDDPGVEEQATRLAYGVGTFILNAVREG